MKIIDYNIKYNEEIKDLLVELQEYIVSIDRDKYNIITDDYRKAYFKKTLNEVKDYKGKIYLAVDNNNKVVGLIVGIINNETMETYDFKVPKRGRITELIVSKKCRSKGIGKLLLNKMENYFRSVGCEGILIAVFGYNDIAQKFYYKNGYFNRNLEIMRKL